MYDGLIGGTHLAATVIAGLAVIYLVLGLVNPGWAGAGGRGAVVLRSLLAILLAFGIAIGVIVYTHMQPDGPHAIDTYIKEYNWEQERQRGQEQPPPPPPAP